MHPFRRPAQDLDLRFASPSSLGSPSHAGPLVVGWTQPTIIYSRMRQIHASAEALDHDVKRYVADPLFQAGWDTWYHETWLPFYQKYAGPDAQTGAKLSAVFETDELARLTDAYRQQLEGFYEDYRKQQTRAGQPVPAPSGQSPTLGEVHRPPKEGGSSVTGAVPWWAWMLGGAAVAGLGYYGYRRYRRMR